MATTGGSSRKPSAVALLEVNDVDDLLKAEPDQWQMIRLSTKSEVSLFVSFFSALERALQYISAMKVVRSVL